MLDDNFTYDVIRNEMLATQFAFWKMREVSPRVWLS